jgi:hypothetical protein
MSDGRGPTPLDRDRAPRLLSRITSLVVAAAALAVVLLTLGFRQCAGALVQMLANIPGHRAQVACKFA